MAKFPRMLQCQLIRQLLQIVVLSYLGFQLAAAPANVIFYCYSVKIEPAILNALGQHRLSFNFSDTAEENGELALLDEDPDALGIRGTDFTLTAPGFGVPITGSMYVDTPFRDANINGVDDIFEVAQVQPAANTSGAVQFVTIDDEEVTGTVVAQWQRPAGATRGTVQLSIAFPGYSRTFLHNFEIFQYVGTMDYTRTGTNVAATMNLTRQGASGTLTGPWSLQILASDELAQSGGAWVASKPNVKFEPTIIDADGIFYNLVRGGLNTNYFGVYQYLNGSPIDPIPFDYALWEIHIFDPNDADRDRIPDLTDPDFGATAAEAPKIAIRLEANAPRLRLTGTPGANYIIEQKASLTAAAWSPVSTVQPAANGVVDVPLVSGTDTVRFWRARVP